MAITYTPWQAGDPPISNTNGVLNASDCEVTPDSGMDIQISTGEAWIRGTFSHTGLPEVLTVSANASGNTRYDLVVIRVTLGTTTAVYAIAEGTTQPTQNDTIWELPLAVVAVPNGAMSIGMGDITDLRIVSNDMSSKSLVTLNYNANLVITPGAQRTMGWNNEIYDPQRAHQRNAYIRVRQTAWYEVKCQFRWEPAVSTFLPIMFDVWGADKDDARIYNIFHSASAQLSAGNVDYIFQRNFTLTQGDLIFCTVTNTSDQNITLKSVGMGLSPQFQLNIQGYQLEL